MFKNNFKKPRPKSNLTKLGNILEEVKQNLGLEEQVKLQMLREIWIEIVRGEISKNSYPGYFDREKNLIVIVKNSVLATELSMTKQELLLVLKDKANTKNIYFKDLRFTLK